MAELLDLRRAAREIFAAALKEVDANEAVRRAVRLVGSRLTILDTTIDLTIRRSGAYVIALGKAARTMAKALDEVLGERLTAGVVAGSTLNMPDEEKLIQQLIDVGQISQEEAETPVFRSVILRAARQRQQDAASASPREYSLSNRWQVFAGGHPLPNEASLSAAQAAFDLLRRADAERALILFLISGGGSAMIEWPRDERITLEELRAANRVLVSCGATIAEINTVRRTISAIKGGSLAALAPHADQVSLIVSDTGAGREVDVASGPTFERGPDALQAGWVVARYGLAPRLPASVLRAINEPPAQKMMAERVSHSLRKHYVLLDNESALRSAAEAARRRGLTVELARDLVEQPVAEGCAQLLSRLFDLRQRTASENQIVCLISGGELACPVKGSGIGGRNAETALRCAIEMDERARSALPGEVMHVVALSAGTDGIDGNSPAAGALADETTLQRAHALGLNAQDFLDRSDAYTFFNKLSDALLTGRTETNVRDLRIMLAD